MRKNRIQDIYGYKMSRGPRRRPSLIAPNRVQCDIYRCEALSGTGTAPTKYDYFEVRQKTLFQPSMANCFAGIFSLNHGQLKSLPSQQSDKTSLCCFCNIQKNCRHSAGRGRSLYFFVFSGFSCMTATDETGMRLQHSSIINPLASVCKS